MKLADIVQAADFALMTPEERTEMYRLIVAEEALDLSNRFVDFVASAWPILEPSNPFMRAKHVEIICDYLEAVARLEIRRLILNIPPRFGKSLLVTVLWPAWVWAKRAEKRFVFASYAAELSTKHSVDRRIVLESPWYRERWGSRVRLSTDQNVKTEFTNTARGVMVSTSVGGSITGKGGDIIVIDDPHNPKKAESDLERKAGTDWFDLTLSSRLDDPATGAIVVVMQRLHEEDLTGHLIEKGGWTLVRLPMEAEAEETVTTPSGAVYVRHAGEMLWPERWPAASVEELKILMGSYGAAGQLQQRPAPAGGGRIKRAWWKFYGEPPAKFDEQIQSWDCTFKDTDDADFVVGTVWGRVGAQFYLLDCVRDRMDFPTTCRAIQTTSAKWPLATLKLIEDKANGPAVIDTLRHRISGLVAVSPEGGKDSRLAAVSPVIESGNVFLPENWAGLEDFIHEFSVFPKGAHDDRVDSTTQALLRFTVRRSGILDFYNTRPAPPTPAPVDPGHSAEARFGVR